MSGIVKGLEPGEKTHFEKQVALTSMNKYFSGASLYGDDFCLSEIQAWYEDEKEGYADLGARDSSSYEYGYHALNQRHGFRYVPRVSFQKVLGFGSAYGEEFRPIADRIEQLVIVDPSDAFVRKQVHGIPTIYVKPTIEGRLPFSDQDFDLVSCLGVLHHIPNVSFVLGELYRCLKPGGFALLREPVVSMGDWRQPRRGLTKRERGIPDHLFDSISAKVGFRCVSKRYCVFPVVPRICKLVFGQPAYNSAVATFLDDWLSAVTRWNLTYHATNPLKKFRPTAVYQVMMR